MGDEEEKAGGDAYSEQSLSAPLTSLRRINV